jgi:hypothetical protein
METIKLLNNEVFNKQDILSKMMDDEFYYGYLGVNALSSSASKKLLDSPYAYYRSLTEKQTNVQALRDGYGARARKGRILNIYRRYKSIKAI